jgi:preprotein translocase subunit SecG
MAQLVQTPLTVVHVLACVFLILVVLLQPGKSGGLGLFASPAATQVFGGRGAGNILTKITWATTVIFFLSSVTLAYLSTSSDESLQERAEAVETPTQPAPAPEPTSPKPAQPPAPAGSK